MPSTTMSAAAAVAAADRPSAAAPVDRLLWLSLVAMRAGFVWTSALAAYNLDLMARDQDDLMSSWATVVTPWIVFLVFAAVPLFVSWSVLEADEFASTNGALLPTTTSGSAKSSSAGGALESIMVNEESMTINAT